MASYLEELEAIVASYSRLGPPGRPPAVRLVFSSGDEVKLNGIVVSPRGATGVFTVRPLTTDRPLYVVRDNDVLLAEIEPVVVPAAGFKDATG